MVPTVSSTGLLTINSTSFWRPTAVAGIDESGNPVVSGVGTTADLGSSVIDTSDARFTRVTQTHQIQLTGAGTYDITAGSCCRVGGIQNASEDSWEMSSTIYWDGSNSNTPIQFNFSAVQPEVPRGLNYTGNLGATSGPGLTLSYDQALNLNINSQPPGFTVNSSTGALAIPGASTATYADNPTGNIGADYAFSGNIFARNASGALRGRVEFDWLFDAVDGSAVNRAPVVDDDVITIVLGQTANHTFTGTDPDGDPLTWSFLNLLGPGAALLSTFDPSTQAFSWDSTGSLLGTYVAQVQASDGSLTDVGQLTINVVSSQIPEPASVISVLSGLGLAFLARRRRS